MTLDELREEIDRADRSLLESFKCRMAAAQKIGLYKAERGMEVLDSSREASKLETIYNEADPEIRPYVKELYATLFKLSRDRQSKLRFGVLGRSLPHTYSPMLHNLYQDEYDYSVIEREPEELDSLFTSGVYRGFNVTIPYKKEAAVRCKYLSEEAEAIGSVNTVVFDSDGEAHGYNTDIYGFTYLLQSNGIDPAGKKCLILGTGGASVAVQYVLKTLKAEQIEFCSRTGSVNYSNVYDLCKDFEIIVNTTPVGMYPKVDETPIEVSRFKNLGAVVDIIYNPGITRLLREAKLAGVEKCVGGLTMLVAQGYKASLLFRGLTMNLDSDSEVINRAERELRSKMQNVAFIGMPGCGKSTLGRVYAERTGREFIDLDVLYEKHYGILPSEDIINNGEDFFRDRESELLATVAYNSGKVLSCGGGIVTRPNNIDILRANSVVVYIRRPLEVLASEGRPLSQREGVAKLYEKRRDLYEAASDKIITLDKMESETDFVREALNQLKKI